MPTFEQLIITDGTHSVDLISSDKPTGFCLNEWSPRITEPKQGGVWADSSLVDGRKPVLSVAGNVIEQMDLAVIGLTTDALAIACRQLHFLLEQAKSYWISTSEHALVYLIAQQTGETNPRHAAVYWYTTPENGDWVDFWSDLERASFPEFSLLMEREPHWSDQVPGVGADTNITSYRTSDEDAQLFGYLDSARAIDYTTSKEVYANAQDAEYNITHIYWWNASGPAFSANLINAALPFDLFPNPVAVGDILYIGSTAGADDQGTFNNLIFDLIPGTLTVVMEHSNVWNTVTPRDNTTGFTVAGVNGVHWWGTSPGAASVVDRWALTNWTQVAVNGVTAQWVRFRVTAIGIGTVPQQQNRAIYSCMWAAFEFDPDDIGGDVNRRLRISMYDESDDSNTAVPLEGPRTKSDLMIVGARRTDRGDDFRAYINLSLLGVANNAGITIAAVDAAGADHRWTAGDVYNTSTITAALTTRVTATLSAALSLHYYGKFRAFLRVVMHVTGGPGIASAQIRLVAQIGSGGLSTASETTTVTLTLAGGTDIIDGLLVPCGDLTIPAGDLLSTEQGDQIQFLVQCLLPNIAPLAVTFDLCDIALIPADEYIGVFEDSALLDDASFLRNGYHLDLDSVLNPATQVRSLLRNSSDEVVANYIPGSPSIIGNPNNVQRFWILPAKYQTTSGMNWYQSLPAMSYRVLIEQRKRFLGLYGDDAKVIW
jgi:hypothetical protein